MSTRIIVLGCREENCNCEEASVVLRGMQSRIGVCCKGSTLVCDHRWSILYGTQTVLFSSLNLLLIIMLTRRKLLVLAKTSIVYQSLYLLAT